MNMVEAFHVPINMLVTFEGYERTDPCLHYLLPGPSHSLIIDHPDSVLPPPLIVCHTIHKLSHERQT